jgi:hypothetical protein
MKKFLFLIPVSLLVALLFTGCEKDGTKLYEATVTVYYPQGYDQEFAEDVLVTVKNITTAQEDTARTDANGIAKFALELGTYTISASNEVTDFYFNGITQNAIVTTTLNDFTIDLIASSKGGGLVFKEIYYTGSKTPAATNYYADQFHEIYNNSDEVIYLDGLCIGVLEPTGSTTSAWVDASGTVLDRLPVTYHALMFPGTGTTYPLQPRTSIVLAQDAINHQTDPLGNSSSPVNLADAQFETYIEAPGKDTDTPASVNLIMMYTTSASMYDWLHSVFGSAVIIFRLPTGLDYATFVANPDNFMTKPGSTSTTQFFMVHKDWVIDAVEICNPDVSKQNKRLPVSLDAGKVFSSGTYTSKSIRRKVSKILDNKVIYQDTNNSTNDFVTEWTPTPFVHPTTVD